MCILAVGCLYVEALFLHIGGNGVYIVKKTGYIIGNYFNSHILCKAARVTYESNL